jgi:hypothetical protein
MSKMQESIEKVGKIMDTVDMIDSMVEEFSKELTDSCLTTDKIRIVLEVLDPDSAPKFNKVCRMLDVRDTPIRVTPTNESLPVMEKQFEIVTPKSKTVEKPVVEKTKIKNESKSKAATVKEEQLPLVDPAVVSEDSEFSEADLQAFNDSVNKGSNTVSISYDGVLPKPVHISDVDWEAMNYDAQLKCIIDTTLRACKDDIAKTHNVLQMKIDDITMYQIFNVKKSRRNPDSKDVYAIVRYAKNMGERDIARVIMKECGVSVSKRQITAATR